MAIWIIGAGKLAREVIGVLQASGQTIAGLMVERGYATADVAGFPVTDDFPGKRDSHASFLVAVGDGRVRQRLVAQLGNVRFAVALHPAATLGPRVRLGDGTIILGPISATTDVEIGSHVLVNPGCLIAHDCSIGSYASLSPGANLTGGVIVDEGAFIGAGAVVIPGCTIGSWAVVGAGSVVVHDVPSGTTVAGIPARPIER